MGVYEVSNVYIRCNILNCNMLCYVMLYFAVSMYFYVGNNLRKNHQGMQTL
jgi:hypothetical protein